MLCNEMNKSTSHIHNEINRGNSSILIYKYNFVRMDFYLFGRREGGGGGVTEMVA